MNEGKPPYSDIHPMRAIFMIPTKPPPSFRDPKNSSNHFIDFVSKCLIKNACQRPSASELLQHDFIQKSKKGPSLKNLIDEVIRVKSLNELQSVEKG